MADLQPPPQPPPPPPSELHLNGALDPPSISATLPAEPTAGPPKRHRRPSVRLGEIGDQQIYDNTRRNKPHNWKHPSKDSKSTKTRQLMNLSGSAGLDFHQTLTLDPGIEDKDAAKPGTINNFNNNNNNNNNYNTSYNNNNNNNNNFVSNSNNNNNKMKRGFMGTKRIRSNWGMKMDGEDENNKLEYEDDFDDVDRYSEDQSLNASMGIDGVRVRVSDGPSGTDGRNWNNGSVERNGVQVWLNQLGLGRYYSIFEVHEVDDEVLPLLTLEDLKDMGINAVGSRRKMFCSIQKLGKGFS